MNLNPKNIWSEEQNKPTLVVRDLLAYAPKEVVYESLLRRGVFKWLSVRRSLIKLKDVWKDRLKLALENQRISQGDRVLYWRGYRRAIEECRAEVRGLCHSARWQAPDIDREATRWLEKHDPQTP